MKIIEGALNTLSFFFYFPTNGSTNPDVLLHPMGNHPSKFQLAWVHCFGGVTEQTSKHTDRLIERLAPFLLLLKV